MVEFKNGVVLDKEEYECLAAIAKEYPPFWFCSCGGCEGYYKTCKLVCPESVFRKHMAGAARRIVDKIKDNLKDTMTKQEIIETMTTLLLESYEELK